MPISYDRLGGPILVNTQTEGNQYPARGLALSNGGFVVVWYDAKNFVPGNPPAPQPLRAQLFAADGSKVGGEFEVSNAVAAGPSTPALAALAGGKFMTVWTQVNGPSDTSGSGLVGRVFNADGLPAGDAFQVNQNVTSAQGRPVATTLANGNVVVAWQDATGDASSYGVKARLYSASGEALGGEFLVNSSVFAQQLEPTVTALANGGFAVAWMNWGDQASGNVQLFDAAGARVGTEIALIPPYQQVTAPNITGLAGGGFVVVWEDDGRYPDDDIIEVKAQVFDKFGATIGDQIVVRSDVGEYNWRPNVEALPDGSFIVGWTREPNGTYVPGSEDVLGQHYDASGNALGEAFQVPGVTAGEQSNVDFITLADGKIVAIFADGSGVGADTSGAAVRIQMLAPSSTPPSDIAFSATHVSETAMEQSVVGSFSATGALITSFSYELLADSTGGAFGLSGDKLIVIDNSKLDFETAPTASVTVEVKDASGATRVETFQIDVADVAVEHRYTLGEAAVVGATQSFAHEARTVALANGGFLVTRMIESGEITGQRIDASGHPIGGEFTVSPHASSWTGYAVTARASGGFAAVWREDSVDSENEDIVMQIFDSSGAAVGAPARVATGYTSIYAMSIAEDSNGHLMAVWNPNDSSYLTDVVAQRFAADGSKIGGTFVVPPSSEGNQQGGQVVALADGRMVVGYLGEQGLHARLFDKNGVAGPEVVLNTEPHNNNYKLAALTDGSFVAVWMSKEERPDGLQSASLRSQHFDANGAPMGDAVLLRAFVSEGSTLEIDAIGTPGNGYMVSWLEEQPLEFQVVMAQLLNADGSPAGDPARVDGARGGWEPGLAVGASGDIFVSWSQLAGDDWNVDGGYRLIRPSDAFATGTPNNDTLTGDSGHNAITGLGGADTFRVEQGGNETLLGGDGNDTFFFGNSFDGLDTVDGGAGTGDRVLLRGSYDVTVGGGGLAGVESLVLLSGADTSFGGIGGKSYDYAIRTVDSNVAAGGMLRIDASGLKSGEVLQFDGALETDGGFTVLGGAGKDQIVGGGGNDVIDGGAGNDAMAGGKGDDRYVVGDAGDVVIERAGEGIDTIDAAFTYSLAGREIENLRLTGSAAIDATGNAYANTIVGNAAANRIDGGAGADSMQGRGGNDRYIVDNAGDKVVEKADEGIDLVEASVSFSLAGQFVEKLTLTGTAAIDGTGNGLDNLITGNNQANRIDGGTGADEMIGRKGDDTYVVDNVADKVVELGGEGSDVVNASVSYSLAGQFAEVLNLTGSAVNGTGNGLANRIVGNELANTINGGAGNDRLDGGAGADTMVGGTGNDVFVVDNVGDKVGEKVGEGTDTVEASISYSLAGQYIEVLKLTGTADLSATGNNQANSLFGNTGANLLDGKGGADTMAGGAGNDRYVVDDAGDKVVELAGEGTDSVEASVTFSLAGQYAENLTLTGSNAINGTGNGLANILIGNGVANTLSGGAGDDLVNGGLGSDKLYGGTGADVFVFDTGLGANNVDQVLDFVAADDTIRLDRSVFGALAEGALSASVFVAGTAALDANDRIVFDKATGNLWYDADGIGAGAAVLFANFGAGETMSAADFVVIP